MPLPPQPPSNRRCHARPRAPRAWAWTAATCTCPPQTRAPPGWCTLVSGCRAACCSAGFLLEAAAAARGLCCRKAGRGVATHDAPPVPGKQVSSTLCPPCSAQPVGCSGQCLLVSPADACPGNVDRQGGAALTLRLLRLPRGSRAVPPAAAAPSSFGSWASGVAAATVAEPDRATAAPPSLPPPTCRSSPAAWR